jgi:hypothetical protein
MVNAFDRANPQWMNPTWDGWSDYKYWPKTGSDYMRGNPEREILLPARKKWGKHRDAMIADLPLGFWTGLFKAHYKNQIWFKRGVIKDVFPDLGIKVPDIVSEMARRLARFRHLRNRVCHHEPIFNWPGGLHVGHTDLSSAHTETLDLLGWLSAQSLGDLTHIDTFLPIWQEGWASCVSRDISIREVDPS